MTHNEDPSVSRRDFLKASAASAAGVALVASGGGVFAQGSDKIKIGLIGCGGRGTGAAFDTCHGNPGVQIVALGDMFENRLNGCRDALKQLGAQQDIAANRCFTGFDAYKGVIASGVDMVILATPPGFRPIHLRAAVEAGKHVFMEKPVAVDGPGVRSVIESGEIAKKKNLGIVAGTQRRHHAGYMETIKRIHGGAIGKVTAGYAYWNGGTPWCNPRQPGQSDMEYQLRNWYFFTWLCGDHIAEQHIHNLDVMNWVMDGHPTQCFGVGGRTVRFGPDHGHIFDHFGLQYDYANGARVLSMCRHWDGCPGNVSEHVVGTEGQSNAYNWIGAKAEWRFTGKVAPEYVQEHIDLVTSIRAGKPLNEARQVAESSLTAIMGRMAAYTGQVVSWDAALNSKEDLSPKNYAFGPNEVPPVALPGKTPLI